MALSILTALLLAESSSAHGFQEWWDLTQARCPRLPSRWVAQMYEKAGVDMAWQSCRFSTQENSLIVTYEEGNVEAGLRIAQNCESLSFISANWNDVEFERNGAPVGWAALGADHQQAMLGLMRAELGSPAQEDSLISAVWRLRHQAKSESVPAELKVEVVRGKAKAPERIFVPCPQQAHESSKVVSGLLIPAMTLKSPLRARTALRECRPRPHTRGW